MKPTFEELVGNYQVLHQTGSTFDLNYDSWTTYAKCSFLEEDQDLMINLLLDLALQEKNMFEDHHVTSIDLSNIIILQIAVSLSIWKLYQKIWRNERTLRIIHELYISQLN